MADGSGFSVLDARPIGLDQARLTGFAVVANLTSRNTARRWRRDWKMPVSTRFAIPDAAVFETDADGLATALAAAAATRPRAVIVIGGDGTARKALETLTPLGIATAPVPAGTLNRLSARVYGTAGKLSILNRIAYGGPDWIPAGEAGGHHFYVASGYGPAMGLGSMREALRRGDFKGAWAVWSRRAGELFDQNLAVNGQTTSMAVVGVGPVDAAFGLAPESPAKELELAAARWRGWTGALPMAPRILLGRWRKAAAVEVLSGVPITITPLARTVSALLDGEPHLFDAPVDLRFVAHGGLVWH